MDNMKINGMYVINIIGCEDCPLFMQEKDICKVIKLDKEDAPMQSLGQGMVKVGCPFHSTDMVLININKDKSIASYIKKHMN